MAKRYPYARWVSDKLRHVPKELQTEGRGLYYSDTGRISHYDEYAKWCRLWGHDYDDSPDGYWDAKTQPWHNPAGVALGLSGVVFWLVSAIVGGSTGQKK